MAMAFGLPGIFWRLLAVLIGCVGLTVLSVCLVYSAAAAYRSAVQHLVGDDEPHAQARRHHLRERMGLP